MKKDFSNIIQYENPTLRKTSISVDFDKIDPKKLDKIITEMKEALDANDDGVAIAAPQINIGLRIFIVAKKAFDLSEKKQKDDHLVFINPEITKHSKKKEILEEGCLSVRWLYGKVKRSSQVSIQAQDLNGKVFKMGASGLIAQIFQHEIDHLNGILFIDKATDIENIPPEKEQIKND